MLTVDYSSFLIEIERDPDGTLAGTIVPNLEHRPRLPDSLVRAMDEWIWSDDGLRWAQDRWAKAVADGDVFAVPEQAKEMTR